MQNCYRDTADTVGNGLFSETFKKLSCRTMYAANSRIPFSGVPWLSNQLDLGTPHYCGEGENNIHTIILCLSSLKTLKPFFFLSKGVLDTSLTDI